MPVPLLALMPVIAALAPYAAKAIGSALGGGEGKRVAEAIEPAVTQAAIRSFGTDDPKEITQVGLRNPATGVEFAKEMAVIAAQAQATAAQMEIERLKLDVANVQGAREHQQKLIASGSWAGYASTIISIMILLGFFGVLTLLVVRPFSISQEQREVLMLMLGALTLAFGDVRNYWLGSSHGSRKKDDALVDQAKTAVEAMRDRPVPVPPVVVAPTPPPPPVPEPAAPPVDLDWKQGPFGGVRFALTPDGVLVEGENAVMRTVGEPVTVRRIWKDFGKHIAEACAREGVPLELVVATIATESRGIVTAKLREPDGRTSIGLTQILTGTASMVAGREVSADELYDVATNISLGTKYIAHQRRVTNYLAPFVAAAYNAGGLHPPREQDTNPWRLRSTNDHISRFCQFYGDACAVAKQDGWSH